MRRKLILRNIRNANIAIEALDEVEVRGDLKIEDGSALTIISHQDLTVSDTKIKESGKLELKSSKNLIIGKNTEFRKGVVLTIKKSE